MFIRAKPYYKMDNSKLIGALNDLIKRNLDAEKGYTEAGNSVRYADVRTYFFDYARQRQQFANDLQNEVRALGGDPEDDSSFLGSLHRAWMDLKADFAENLAEPVFEECARGEEYAIEDYNNMLENIAMSDRVRGILERQREAIKKALQEVRKYEARYEIIEEDKD